MTSWARTRRCPRPWRSRRHARKTSGCIAARNGWGCSTPGCRRGRVARAIRLSRASGARTRSTRPSRWGSSISRTCSSAERSPIRQARRPMRRNTTWTPSSTPPTWTRRPSISGWPWEPPPIPNSPDTAVMDADCGKAAKKKTPALTARQVAARCAPAAADTMRKYHVLADPQYAMVAKTYQAGLAKNPYSRDALYNLAGVSYLIGDSANVLPLAQRLYALDPMNRSTLAKLAGGWQLKGKKDSVLYYLTIADSLPVEITVSSFTPTEKGATLDGQMTNFRPKASAPLKIAFEFLNAQGEAVGTQTKPVPALEPNASEEFKLKVEQPGVVAWRYKRS